MDSYQHYLHNRNSSSSSWEVGEEPNSLTDVVSVLDKTVATSNDIFIDLLLEPSDSLTVDPLNDDSLQSLHAVAGDFGPSAWQRAADWALSALPALPAFPLMKTEPSFDSWNNAAPTQQHAQQQHQREQNASTPKGVSPLSPTSSSSSSGYNCSRRLPLQPSPRTVTATVSKGRSSLSKPASAKRVPSVCNRLTGCEGSGCARSQQKKSTRARKNQEKKFDNPRRKVQAAPLGKHRPVKRAGRTYRQTNSSNAHFPASSLSSTPAGAASCSSFFNRPRSRSRGRKNDTSMDRSSGGSDRNNSGRLSDEENEEGLASSEGLGAGPSGFAGMDKFAETARQAAIQRYYAKRAKRVWTKRTQYQSRKNAASSRARVAGRFV